ncbi:MAG: cysteine--tRNA ligase [Bdellovibrio sp.]|jgi:cysteinyl-tRNA synthetase
MSLQVYNTLTRQVEAFVPHDPQQVKMYLCGPTVYGLLHVGNFRGPIFFNLVRNWLEFIGYKVTFVYNFTDVDDRIIEQSRVEGLAAGEVAERYIAEFKTDFNRLKLRPHDLNPKVTETMPEIISMVGELIEKGKAYAVKGDVNFLISDFPGYGKLSNRKTEDMMTAVRIERDADKKGPLDFALWKSAKPGEPAWTSPWGDGRPGWHIECSAMIRKHLGDQIDIHGGGLDLVFPHHENEIAQSEGCSGHTFVKYWMHNNMINFGGSKMSKSLGNIMRGREFMDLYNAEILKFMMCSAHYRSVLDFSDEAVENATKGLARIYSALALAESLVTSSAEVDAAFEKICTEAWTQIEVAMNNDFGTPEALARIYEVIRHFNTVVKRGMKTNPNVAGKSLSLISFVKKFGALMSLFQEPPAAFLKSLDDMLLAKMKVDPLLVQTLVDQRSAARSAKDFAKSDELRKTLTEMGISVLDLPEGSFWEVTK